MGSPASSRPSTRCSPRILCTMLSGIDSLLRLRSSSPARAGRLGMGLEPRRHVFDPMMRSGHAAREPDHLRLPCREPPAVPLQEQDGRRNPGPVVGVRERMLPDQAVAQGRRLLFEVGVELAGGGPSEGAGERRDQRAEVAHPVPPSRSADDAIVQGQHLDGRDPVHGWSPDSFFRAVSYRSMNPSTHRANSCVTGASAGSAALLRLIRSPSCSRSPSSSTSPPALNPSSEARAGGMVTVSEFPVLNSLRSMPTILGPVGYSRQIVLTLPRTQCPMVAWLWPRSRRRLS